MKPRAKPAAIQANMVRRLRMGVAVSRVELARQLKLSPSTIGLYVDRLIAQGFLREGDKVERASGRPPKVLQLNPRAGQFVGIDFEARTLRAIAVDFSQQTIVQREYSLAAAHGVEEVLATIERALAETASRRPPLLGVGLAVPGVVDAERGVASRYRYIRGWHDVPLVERLSHRFRGPIYLENNIRAMALAEQWFGQGRELDSFVCIGIRSGIGAGIVLDRRLVHGKANLAGEIGGWPCATAHAGEGHTLEDQASITTILERLGDAVRSGRATSLALKRNRVTLSDFLQAARDGDKFVLSVLRNAGHAVGRVVGQLNLLLNPQQVIVAGPLAELGDVFVRYVREGAALASPALNEEGPSIVPSELGAYAGAIGAAALAVHQWRPAR
jgi:N-acetylglucosamine repressor